MRVNTVKFYCLPVQITVSCVTIERDTDRVYRYGIIGSVIARREERSIINVIGSRQFRVFSGSCVYMRWVWCDVGRPVSVFP